MSDNNPQPRDNVGGLGDVLDVDVLSDTGDTGRPRVEDGILTEVSGSPDIDGSSDGAVHATGGSGHQAAEGGGGSVATYLKIAAILAVLTALETSTYWIDLGGWATPLLLIMMTAKFILVLLFFMHLKFDNKLFGTLFYMGMALTLMVYLGVLFSYRFFFNS